MNTRSARTSIDDRAQILDVLYPVPDSIESHESFQHYAHQDLDTMSSAELQLERGRARWRLLFDSTHTDWLLSRLKAIEEARHHAG